MSDTNGRERRASPVQVALAGDVVLSVHDNSTVSSRINTASAKVAERPIGSEMMTVGRNHTYRGLTYSFDQFSGVVDPAIGRLRVLPADGAFYPVVVKPVMVSRLWRRGLLVR